MGLLKFLKNQSLLVLQDLVLDRHYHKLIMTEKQLIREAERIARNDLKIINDCTKLINTTVKPDVFFMRYDLLKEKANHLAKFQPYINIKGTPPNRMVREITAKEQFAVAEFLNRYYTSVDTKAKTLKTEKSQNNQYIKFYDSLQPYYDKMDDNNKKYVEDRKPIQSNVNELTFVGNSNN